MIQPPYTDDDLEVYILNLELVVASTRTMYERAITQDLSTAQEWKELLDGHAHTLEEFKRELKARREG